MRGTWGPNITATFWPPLLWPSALCLSRSTGLLNRRPSGPHRRVWAFSTASCHQRVSKHHRGVPRAPSTGCCFPYHIVSATSLDPNSSGAPRAHCAGLSLSHLISNFSWPQLIRGSKGPRRRAFYTTSYQQLLWTPTHWLPVFTELYNS